MTRDCRSNKKKHRSNKKLFPWRNKAKWIDEQRAQKGLYNSKLYWRLSYFSFFNCFCISISAIASLLSFLIGIMSSAIGLKICAITAGIKRYMSVIKKSKKKHDKIVVLAKSKLSRIEDVISKALIDSIISQGEFVLINIVVKEYNGMKVEIII